MKEWKPVEKEIWSKQNHKNDIWFMLQQFESELIDQHLLWNYCFRFKNKWVEMAYNSEILISPNQLITQDYLSWSDEGNVPTCLQRFD